MNWLFSGFNLFHTYLESIILQVLPEPQAGLLAGIFLGSKKALPRSFYEALKNTGTLHIVVASGMNISLLAGSTAEFLARFLKRKLALIISFLIIISYCLLVGPSPPIIRASLMAAIFYWANFSGREAKGLIALIVSGLIMLLISPKLLFDVSFQLSFSATLGLIILSPKMQKAAKKYKFLIPELTQTLACQIFTFPILVITFGHFNPLSTIPNLLVLWLVPYLTYCGLLITFSGLISLGVAQFFAWLVFLPLTYFVKVIEVFGTFRFLNLSFPGLSWVIALGYYLVILGLLFLR